MAPGGRGGVLGGEEGADEVAELRGWAVGDLPAAAAGSGVGGDGFGPGLRGGGGVAGGGFEVVEDNPGRPWLGIRAVGSLAREGALELLTRFPIATERDEAIRRVTAAEAFFQGIGGGGVGVDFGGLEFEGHGLLVASVHPGVEVAELEATVGLAGLVPGLHFHGKGAQVGGLSLLQMPGCVVDDADLVPSGGDRLRLAQPLEGLARFGVGIQGFAIAALLQAHGAELAFADGNLTRVVQLPGFADAFLVFPRRWL